MNESSNPAIPFINSSLVTWFMSPEMRGAESYESYNQRTVILIGLLGVFWGPIFASLYWLVFGQAQMFIAVITATIITIISLCVIRKWGLTAWASHVICATIFALIIYLSVLTGGVESPVLCWIIVAPIFARAFHPKPSPAAFWTVLTCLAVAVLFTLPLLSSWAPRNILEPWQNQLLFATVVASLLITCLLVFATRHGIETWLLKQARSEESRMHEAEAQMRRIQETWLEQSKDSLRTLIENSPEGIIVHRDAHIVYANPAFRELTGYDEESMAGVALEQLTRPEDRDDLEKTLHLLRNGEVVPMTDQFLVRKDGKAIPVEFNAFQTNFDGEPVIISITRDISQRREFQAKLMQVDRMLAVGTLAAGVAHEINNPLAFVHSNLEFLIRRVDETRDCDSTTLRDLKPHQTLETLFDAIEGTDRIRNIISDLRTFTHNEDIDLKPTQVEAMLESAIKMAGKQIQHRAQLVRDFEPLPTIESDPSRLAQVFLNLLVNAAQAIEEGAAQDNVICVRTRHVGQEVIVEITDTGHGISPERMHHIFDPFVTSKSQQEGMGLGLSICRNTIQSLDGRIEVESQVGKGSTFRVILPAQISSELSTEFELTELPEPTGDRIIIIDDEPRLLRALKRQLGEAFEVETFSSAAKALEYLDIAAAPMAILCDLQMPDISGADFFRSLKNKNAILADRVVFMTGGAFTQEVQRFLQEDNYRLLTKPFELEDFFELIRGL